MAKKIYDLAVKTGSYTNGNGETKGRYKNVGAIFQNDEGGEFIMIDPTFNFGAVRRPEGKDMVMVSRFEPKNGNQQQPKPLAWKPADPSDIAWEE